MKNEMNGEVKVEKKKVLLKSTDDEYEHGDTKPRTCSSCNQPIVDRFLLKINDVYFHETCLKCCVCDSHLNNACFYKDSRTLCKKDYARIHGCKCSGCDSYISPNELVMKALQNIYHVDCFKCNECDDKLEKGDEFILKDGKLFCSADFNVADQKFDIDVFSSDEYDSVSTISATSPTGQEKLQRNARSNCKRPRTILTSQQREDFKAAFEITPKPCRKVREQLSNGTGLSVRVVQVWFQNQRAKLKKIQKKSESGVMTNNIERIKKVNIGKADKKKRTKSNSSVKSSDSSSTVASSDFNSPNAHGLTAPFQSMMDINENYPPIMMPYLTNNSLDVNNNCSDTVMNSEANNNNNNNNNYSNNHNFNNNIMNTSQHTLSTLSSLAVDGMVIDFNPPNKSLMNPFSRIHASLLEHTIDNTDEQTSMHGNSILSDVMNSSITASIHTSYLL